MADEGKAGPNTLKEAAAAFLERDFNQCFSQMRHYDSQIFNLTKFSFTAYTGLLGIAIGFFEFSTEQQTDLSTAIIVALFTALLCGVFLLSSVVRNRVYFVKVARYVNEHRSLYLDQHPHGFCNQTGMYTDPNEPEYMNWKSSHSWFVYLLSLLNGTVLIAALYVLYKGTVEEWFWFVLPLFVALQIGAAVLYLNAQGD
jgi:hypothetical protein